MNEGDQFIPVYDEPAPAAPATDDIQRVLLVVILIICERQKFITRRISKLAQRFADALSDPPSPSVFWTLRSHANHSSEERRRYFFCSQFYHGRVVNKEGVPCCVRHRSDDALRPRVAHGGKEHLKDRRLLHAEFRHSTDESRQGIWVKTLEGAQGPHE